MKNDQATSYRTASVENINIFYREAGDPKAPTVVLLHGYPTSSHMFRNLIPILAKQFHVVAPDLPGFGFSDAPNPDSYDYTFENVAQTVGDFIDQIGLKKFAIYIFDYGAPIGLRIGLRDPNRITAVITQNGNAYLEGLSDKWNPVQAFWENPSEENREAIQGFVTPSGTEFQYHYGVENAKTRIAPEAVVLDNIFLSRPQSKEIQLKLIGDYKSNVALYPKFQEFFRSHRLPILATWGKNDPFFLPAGAEAFRKDNPATKIVFYDTGHFALETHASEIGAEITSFLLESHLED
jgi:pimeloyl-ACP methyl ester carboxylesterase